MDSTKFNLIFSKGIYQLPLRWDGKDFYATLYKHLKKYREDIENYFPDMSGHSLEVKAVCNGICAAVDFSLRGYPGNAYKSFEGVMEMLSKEAFLVNKKIIEKEQLYRVVALGNAAEPTRQRIFHVPFNLRSRMSTQRYSIPGFPSLYLGSSVKLCCLELGKDIQRDFVCVSRYELQTDRRINRFPIYNQTPVFDNDELKIFDVSIKPNNAIEDMCHDVKKIAVYIKWYPLIAACSYIRAVRDAPYSAEYIIPQLFLQWVRSVDEEAVVGIKYFSCASMIASTLGNNYVFPTMGTPYNARTTITNYCARLSHRFQLTAPRFIMEYESIEDCINDIKEDYHLDYIEGHEVNDNDGIEVEYTIPEGVSAIGSFAFSGCSKLEKITIPDSVTSIGDSAFNGCINLKTITIPDSVRSIGKKIFNCCFNLESITIPDSVASIGDDFFSNCSSLKSITIPDSVTRIGNRAFLSCSNLESITIPDSVTYIGYYAFHECYSLRTIYYSGTSEQAEKLINGIGWDGIYSFNWVNKIHQED